MWPIVTIFTALSISPFSVSAAALRGPPWSVRPRTSSCNTPSNRACWSPGFAISTDYETSTPSTGVTRTFTLTLTEVDNWVGGDGVVKAKAMLVNGQFPGPAITADWGDRISVTVVNQLATNGTSIHWHGIRQLGSNVHDGSSGVTECPMPPGASKTYSFLATQHGTSWYHAHFSSQYGNGVVGPIVINGPASANYDVDLGPLLVSDWYYAPVDQLLARMTNPSTPGIPGFAGSPPPSDNVLFNGRNVDPQGGGGGSYLRMNLTPGKVHRLRLVNPSVNDAFTLSLAGHSLTIIAADFVPVQPRVMSSLHMAVGQRYDVLINASSPAGGAFWFNATYSSGPCGLSNNARPAAVFAYGGTQAMPTTGGKSPPDTHCADASAGLVPVVSRTVPADVLAPNAANTTTLNVAMSVDAKVARVFWPVNGAAMKVSWSDPTLAYVANGSVGAIPRSAGLVSVPGANTWVVWLVQNASPVPHPLHLHGHDLLVLGSSPAPSQPLAPGQPQTTFDAARDGAKLSGDNPPRRDTTVLPALGWVVVAFYTNNPGAWLFHCHVAWHVSQGLSVQFLEQQGSIMGNMDVSGTLNPNCKKWRDYFPSKDPFGQTDSGI